MAESRYLGLPEVLISVAGLHNFLDAASGEGADAMLAIGLTLIFGFSCR
jgi:hypothetical protein